MLLYLCSDLQDEDIPHRTKFTELIMERFKVKFTDVMRELQVCVVLSQELRLLTDGQSAEGRISYTSDLWSNMKLASFMAITAHFMGRDERGNLVVKTRLIAFRAVAVGHTGENLARIFYGILKEYSLLYKVILPPHTTNDKADNCASDGFDHPR